MFFRKIYFINKKFQTRFILEFVLAVICWAAVTVWVYSSLVEKKLDALRYSSHVDIKTTGDLLLPITLGTHLISFLLFAAILAYTMRSIMKKLSPPLYSIKKDLARIASGDLTSEVSLCKGEEFQELASELEQMRQGLRDKFELIKDRQLAVSSAILDIDSAVNNRRLSMTHIAMLQSETARLKESVNLFQCS
ncbi:MAG: methyl-accepting chemotaxis protein [Geobacteraceae bacterium]|nr:methyl-accepting chemotaxis protein [Geobacteraceae bacterium]NTW79814.1 methyl-accepting chemotaxis protein [Geobacteraceae bacterium]